MKLKDLIKEEIDTGKMTDFLEQYYQVQAFNTQNEPMDNIDDMVTDDGDGFAAGLTDLFLTASHHDLVFDPPIGSNDWKDLEDLSLDGNDGETIWHVLENFENIPNVKNLRLRSCKIKSLKGIEKLNRLNVIECIKLTGVTGVLRLLKAPNLKRLSTIGWLDPHGESKDLRKAFKIVERYLESKDIAECQGELIDAGLDEYAKL